MKCLCVFCSSGRPKFCVWKNRVSVTTNYHAPKPEPMVAWRVVLDWALAIIFVLALFVAQLLAGG